MINANEINSNSNSNSNNESANRSSGIIPVPDFDHPQAPDRMNSNHPDNNNSSNCEGDLTREVEGKLNFKYESCIMIRDLIQKSVKYLFSSKIIFSLFKMKDIVLVDMKEKSIPQIMEAKEIIPESGIPRRMMDPHLQLLHSHRKLPHLQFSNFLG